MTKEILLNLNGKQVEVKIENIRNVSENLVLSGCYVETGEMLSSDDLGEIQSLIDDGDDL